MVHSSVWSLALAFSAVQAAPGPAAKAAPAAAAATPIGSENALVSALSALSKGASSAFPTAYTSMLSAIVPMPTPSSPEQFASAASSAYKAYPSDPLAAGAEILLQGLSGGSFQQDLDAFGACNSVNNNNYVYAYPPVYPKKSASDAPYDVSEASLRGAIYIPKTFQYGAKTPLLFIPGTGVEACEDFATNLGKLFANSSFADPVYVNVPDNMLADLQTSAEYVAYAINYISRISHNKPVALATWSAGSLTAQWALKYWPSTRDVITDVINVSGDLHGTVLAPIICPPGFPCPPSVLQQFYNAKFIQKLRDNGGDSAYVPTTSIWSIFDEIVEPQQTPPGASAMVNDARHVGVTNAQTQNICPPGTPAGGPNFGHENALYNAVTYALAKDALTNSGPANIARSGAANVCSQFFAQGLTLADVFATEALIPLAGFNIEAYPKKVVTEPPIKSYAA